MTILVQDAAAAGAPQAVRTALRTLLVHVQAGPSGAVRLAAAVELARKFDAVLFGVAAEMIPPLGAMDPTGMLEGAWYLEMREQLQRDLELAREAFRVAGEGLETEFASIQDMPADAVARASRGADLIVAGGHPLSETDGFRHCGVAEIMLSAGRPVLVVPPAGGVLKAQAVVVAWKDSRESRRALADALPFLTTAETVLVMEVCGKGEAQDADLRAKAVVAGLKRHGVKAHARVVTASPDRVAAELHRAADVIGADLIVAGGYGHTRLGEWVFGGVTRDLLHDPQRFVLLSH